jgi:hypothetical protein
VTLQFTSATGRRPRFTTRVLAGVGAP